MAQGKVHPGGTWDCAVLPLYFLVAEISALLVMSDKILLCFQLQRGKSFNQSLLVIIWKEGTRFGWKVCEPLTDVSSTNQQKIIGSEILVENEHPRIALQEVTHCVGGKK